MGGFQAQYEAGLNAAAATSMALFLQGMTGEGQHIDISTTECVGSTMIANQTLYSFTGAIQTRRSPVGSAFGHPMLCADGWVIAQTGAGADWNDMARFFDRPQLLEPRFVEQARSAEYDKELDAVLLDAIKDRGKWELFARPRICECSLVWYRLPEDLAHCPQLKAREFFREVDHPVMGKLMVPAVLFNSSQTPYQLGRPAPLLGQHNLAIYRDRMGYGAAGLVRLRQFDII